jgi:predicted transcriptional regulator
MGEQRTGDGEDFRLALDRIADRVRRASYTDWSAPEESAQDEPADERAARLVELEREERELSKRRRELHARIDSLQAAPTPLSLTFAAQLDAFKRAEVVVSANRHRLHREIDELAGSPAGPASAQ